MRVVLAPNAFKGTFGAIELAEIWRNAVEELEGVEATTRPLADGGDGFVAVVRHYRPDVLAVHSRVRDPLGRPVAAEWGWDPGSELAYLESALAIGLRRLDGHELDPEATDTFGLGQLILAASELGARRIFVGLGGSATVDGGWGMARALGYRFVSEGGSPVEAPAGLRGLARIEPPDSPPLPEGTRLVALADVRSPLLGPRGAAPVYAPQKGADEQAVARLAAGLERLSERWVDDLGAPPELADRAGAGAAGGLGAGLVAFLGAELARGPEGCAEIAGLRDALGDADALVTGEGRFDEQSADDKGTGHALRLARAAGIPAAVVCGVAEHRPGSERILVLDGSDLDPPVGERLDRDAVRRLVGAAVERLEALL